MIDDVVAALEKDARFSAWQVTEARGRSTQRYQVFKEVEARRVVESRTCDVRVHVEHGGAHAGTMGESSFIAVDPRSLPGALDAAFARARLVKNKPWTLSPCCWKKSRIAYLARPRGSLKTALLP